MKIEELLEQGDTMMFEMANLPVKRTGLSTIIYFGEVGGQHGPRIKASNVKGKFAKFDNFTITVDKEPRLVHPEKAKLSNDEIEDIKDWIKLNYEKLMWLWKAHETGDDVEVSINGKTQILDAIEILSMLEKI